MTEVKSKNTHPLAPSAREGNNRFATPQGRGKKLHCHIERKRNISICIFRFYKEATL
ncbi:hypothetical protein [Helicobacter sp. T3_23-1059]